MDGKGFNYCTLIARSGIASPASLKLHKFRLPLGAANLPHSRRLQPLCIVSLIRFANPKANQVPKGMDI
jgi:hypothetical protein